MWENSLLILPGNFSQEDNTGILSTVWCFEEKWFPLLTGVNVWETWQLGHKECLSKGKQDSILGKLTTTGQRTCMPGWCNFFWNVMFMRESRYAPVIRGCTCLSYHLKSIHYMAGKNHPETIKKPAGSKQKIARTG